MNSFDKKIKEILNRNKFIYDELFCIFSTLNNIPTYYYKLTKGNSFFRARKNNIFQNFETFSDLVAPPNHLVKSFSRANAPFQSVFYLSDQWITNIAELKPFLLKGLAVGDIIWVTQTKWILTEDINIAIIPDFENKKMMELVKEFISNDLSEDQINFLKLINSYFRQPVSPDEYNSSIYKLTSAYCNSLIAESIRSNQKLDGILFTSVEHDLGFNIALSSDITEKNKIKIESVVKHFLRKTSDNEFDNFIDPNKPTRIDFDNQKIIW